MLKRWIEFQTEESNWLIDLEFLMSDWTCGFGSTCKGINPQRPDLGCCANGAYLSQEDQNLLHEKSPLLTRWQHKTDNYIERVVNDEGEEEFKTAIVDNENWLSGCVFANDADYEHGAGCALHHEALIRGEKPMDWKPAICWQLPLDVTYVEQLDTYVLHMFHWSPEDFDWYCGNDEITWVGEKPVYQYLSGELEKLCSEFHGDPDAYTAIKDICDQAFAQSAQWRGDKAFIRPVPVTLRDYGE